MVRKKEPKTLEFDSAVCEIASALIEGQTPSGRVVNIGSPSFLTFEHSGFALETYAASNVDVLPGAEIRALHEYSPFVPTAKGRAENSDPRPHRVEVHVTVSPDEAGEQIRRRLKSLFHAPGSNADGMSSLEIFARLGAATQVIARGSEGNVVHTETQSLRPRAGAENIQESTAGRRLLEIIEDSLARVEAASRVA